MKGTFALFAAGALVAASGCGESGDEGGKNGGRPEADPENLACIEANPPAGDDAYESDDQDCPELPPGQPEGECTPVTPEDIAEQCEVNGASCDPEEFISRDAALCIAEEENLAEGIAAWRANLSFNHTHMRPVWTVDNLLEEGIFGCESSGNGVMIDAETGVAIDEYSWRTVC
jgi:hypothetical protein